MFLVLVTYLTALALSAIAAYYSIIGLTTIFAASFWPIVIMGSSLELAKIVALTWVYRNWNTAHNLMKAYLCIAIFILMFITSMGTFGYLSKAHTEVTTVSGVTAIRLETLTQQEKLLRERLQYLLQQTNKVEGVNTKIDRQVQDVTSKLEAVNQEKLPLLQEKNKLDADVGPLKYIAELIYGESSATQIDKAVRAVIILIVTVFDPLAVALLIAANSTTVPKPNTIQSVEQKPLKKRGRPRRMVQIDPDSIVRF